MCTTPVLTLVLGAVLFAAACGSGAEEDLPTPAVLTGGPETPRPAAAATEPPAAPTPGDTTPPEEETREPTIVSLDWLARSLSSPSLPADIASPTPDPDLLAIILDSLAGVEGEHSVVVYHLSRGSFAALNDDHVYYGASLFKMALLLQAYRLRDAGELDFGELLELTEEYAAYNLGTLEYLGIAAGDMISVADAVKAMIVISDTPSAVLIQDKIGCPRADSALRELGIEVTRTCDRSLPATARDMAVLMLAIAAGEGVSEQSRLEMLSLLQQEGFRSGVPAGLPPGVVVAHKTGSFSGATHDVALVWGASGPYIIAVLTNRSFDWQPIADVSRAVWKYFEGS
jgi:beta-lactamase class A